MQHTPALNSNSEIPLYRQLFEHIALQIRSGELAQGERLPATRELAGQLGLNRTTVSAAYELLETEGLISGQVGRGSFVTGLPPEGRAPGSRPLGPAREWAGHGPTPPARVNWPALLERGDQGLSAQAGPMGRDAISFVMSRPSRELFPLDDF
ncbi:MAG: GntR family transcriptional regulator, partial [Candidatus Binataceae bacterium]